MNEGCLRFSCASCGQSGADRPWALAILTCTYTLLLIMYTDRFVAAVFPDGRIMCPGKLCTLFSSDLENMTKRWTCSRSAQIPQSSIRLSICRIFWKNKLQVKLQSGLKMQEKMTPLIFWNLFYQPLVTQGDMTLKTYSKCTFLSLLQFLIRTKSNIPGTSTYSYPLRHSH